MKKTMLLMAAAVMAFTAAAQVQIKSITELEGTRNQGFYHPKFSPAGDFLLFSTANYQGLMRYNLKDGSMKQLTDADNAGYETQISEGGKMVVFRDVQYINNRRYTSIKRVNTETGEIAEIDAPSREKYAFAFNGGVIRIAKQKQMLSQRLVSDVSSDAGNCVVAIEDMSLVLYKDNVRRVLNPQGEGSYIWPSISPDGKHIVYAVSRGQTSGTYVCDLDGGNAVCLGYVGAPKWLGNNYIVGMLDLWDDGHTYTRSPLITIRIDGQNRQVMDIPNHPVVLYPAASRRGDRIAFEADGAVYMMNVEIK